MLERLRALDWISKERGTKGSVAFSEIPGTILEDEELIPFMNYSNLPAGFKYEDCTGSFLVICEGAFSQPRLFMFFKHVELSYSGVYWYHVTLCCVCGIGILKKMMWGFWYTKNTVQAKQ